MKQSGAQEELCCALCGIELDGSEFYMDTCDECARREGLLDEEDEE